MKGAETALHAIRVKALRFMNQTTTSFRDRLLGNPDSQDWLDQISRQNEALLASSSATIEQRPDGPKARTALPGPVAALAHRKTFREVYRLAKVDPSTIGAAYREELEARQVKIDEIAKEWGKIHNGDLLEWRLAVKRRIARGRATAADVASSNGNMRETKRVLRRRKHREIESARPQCVAVAKEVEAIAERVLPKVIAQAERIGVKPEDAPLCVAVKQMTYLPSYHAARTIDTPALFFRKLGLKL